MLIKYWFSITDDEQHLRFLMRIHDPLKQWKLSPMDLESRRRWEQYTKAKEEMLERTHIPEAPWWVVEARRQEAGAAQLHPPPAAADPLRGGPARADRAAGARAQARLRAQAGAGRHVHSGTILGLFAVIAVALPVLPAPSSAGRRVPFVTRGPSDSAQSCKSGASQFFLNRNSICSLLGGSNPTCLGQ